MKDKIFLAAVEVVREHGFAGLTKPRIAERAGCSPTLVAHYLGPIAALINTIVEHALLAQDLPIIARALVDRHPAAMAAPAELKEKAAQTIAQG